MFETGSSLWKITLNPLSSNNDFNLHRLICVYVKQTEEKKHIEAFNLLIRLFETTHIDNFKILKTLIQPKEDLPIVDGVTKKRVWYQLHIIQSPLHMHSFCLVLTWQKDEGEQDNKETIIRT